MPRKLTTEEFIKKAKEIHGDKYDYSKIEYINQFEKVCIICPTHGKFWQKPKFHLKGQGCKKCATSSTTEEFIKKAKEIHGDKYDYSKVEYMSAKTKICIICPKHGEFWQTPNDHLCKKGCPLCSHRSFKYTTEEFINKANEIHGNKYDYSKVKYVNVKTKIEIICPKHGSFFQTPHNHLNGQGCQLCLETKLENEISTLLETVKNVSFVKQKHFDWLGHMSLDFFIPSKNIAIECQGIQHFKEREWFGGTNGLIEQKLRDEKKKQLCEEHGIKLIYYSNLGIEYPYKVFEDKNELLEEIQV